MTTNEIRSKFLSFFKTKDHSIIASDSLVPKDDPTVLFTTAGMQQFKPQFLGRIDGFTRAATAQKCLRTDDLDVVGKTDFHHTFFEMLGNFSFGDYFKKDAIHWAWEFLTVEMQLPKEFLWVSVYQDDNEAYDIWASEIKVPTDRIVRLGDKSNFWPSNAKLNGPNGPCGPCSEIFYDYGVNAKCPIGDKCNPDCSCGRFSEVWNLVFTQYNRKDGGVLEPLPAKNIDTGMGLERLVAVVQGKKSNYQTDNFAKILDLIKGTFKANGAQLTESEFRIVADHMRAITIGLADGVVPSNEGRGYVMRKLIVDITDLAIRAGIEKPVIHTFVDVVVDVLKEPYPELVVKVDEIKVLVKRIEEAFMKVRRERVPELKEKLAVVKTNVKELGDILFLFRDTHGLTLSTIMGVAHEGGIDRTVLDEAVKLYEAKMEVQKNRSRASSKMMGDVFADQNFDLNVPKTEFLGYSETTSQAEVLKIFNDQGEVSEASQGQAVKIVLNRTPFYAQSGGQVGDAGTLSNNIVKGSISDTQKINDIYVHATTIDHGSLKVGDKVEASIDVNRRAAIMRNHTATHLLQAAMREILGAHVKQQGSSVDENRLRFDFTHHQGIKLEEIAKLENRLTQFIGFNDAVKKEVLPIEEAKKRGALAFFAEKYGDVVRVISIGDYSTEFCGGTHVNATGDIEAVKIVSEGSVAQGIRRIEAVTSRSKVNELLALRQQEEMAKQEQARHRQLDKEKAQVRFNEIKNSIGDVVSNAQDKDGLKVIVQSYADIDMASLRQVSDLFKKKAVSAAVFLGARNNDDVSVVVSLTDDLVARGLKANELVAQIAPLINGNGGGRPNLAQAGGKNVAQLDNALSKLKEMFLQQI